MAPSRPHATESRPCALSATLLNRPYLPVASEQDSHAGEQRSRESAQEPLSKHHLCCKRDVTVQYTSEVKTGSIAIYGCRSSQCNLRKLPPLQTPMWQNGPKCPGGYKLRQRLACAAGLAPPRRAADTLLRRGKSRPGPATLLLIGANLVHHVWRRLSAGIRWRDVGGIRNSGVSQHSPHILGVYPFTRVLVSAKCTVRNYTIVCL